MPHDLTRATLLLGYTIVSVAGMVLMKSAGSPFSLKAGMGFVLYLAGFIIWIGIILRLMPLSQAFPMAAGTLMLGTQLAGWLLLKERIGIPQGAGVMLILAGVILVSTASHGRA